LSNGGDVTILANGVVRGTGIIDNSSNPSVRDNTTIFTQGQSPSRASSVVIQHNGGLDNFRFTVGDATHNGTAGAINAGADINNIISPSRTFPNLSTVIDNNHTDTQGNISITFINQPPPEVSNVLQLNTQQNEPISF
jgi:hypothetical protein